MVSKVYFKVGNYSLFPVKASCMILHSPHGRSDNTFRMMFLTGKGVTVEIINSIDQSTMLLLFVSTCSLFPLLVLSIHTLHSFVLPVVPLPRHATTSFRTSLYKVATCM